MIFSPWAFFCMQMRITQRAVPPLPFENCMPPLAMLTRQPACWPCVCAHHARTIASAPTGCAHGALAEPGRACAPTMPALSPVRPPAALAAPSPSLAVQSAHDARTVASAPTGCAGGALAALIGAAKPIHFGSQAPQT